MRFHGEDLFLRRHAVDGLDRTRVRHGDLERHLDLRRWIRRILGLRRLRLASLGLRLFEFLWRILERLAHLRERHHRVGLLLVVDLGQRLLVEIDDFGRHLGNRHELVSVHRRG